MAGHKRPRIGKFAHEITDEMKTEFIQLIYDGLTRNLAAQQIDTTSTRLRRLCNPHGAHYDPDFCQAWAEAEASEEHQRNSNAELRALLYERARSSDRILEKLAINQLPEWEHWKHRNFQVDINIRQLVAQLPTMTDEQLQDEIRKMEQTLEQPARPSLPPGDGSGE